MGREVKITYEQVAAAADAMCAANIRPSSRTLRKRLGNTGSMGTINRLLQEWKATQERQLVQPLTLPPILQRAILDFMAQELATAKAQLESTLAEQRQEMADLAIENERQGAISRIGSRPRWRCAPIWQHCRADRAKACTRRADVLRRLAKPGQALDLQLSKSTYDEPPK